MKGCLTIPSAIGAQPHPQACPYPSCRTEGSAQFQGGMQSCLPPCPLDAAQTPATQRHASHGQNHKNMVCTLFQLHLPNGMQRQMMQFQGGMQSCLHPYPLNTAQTPATQRHGPHGQNHKNMVCTLFELQLPNGMQKHHCLVYVLAKLLQ